MSDNRCIFCDNIIPEGIQVCRNCEVKCLAKTENNDNNLKPKNANKLLYILSNNLFLFYILSFTWGILTSLIGLILILPFLITKKFKVFKGRLYGIFPKIFGEAWGFEMGCFFFVSNDCAENNDKLYYHEMGHGIQNILFGPLMLFIVSIPSVVRYWYREIKYYRKGKTPTKHYDSIWFEGQATRFGFKYLSQKKHTL